MTVSRPLEERFAEKVRRAGEADCWEWLAAKNSCGYGSIGLGPGKGTALAHRVAVELDIGQPIPPGMTIDHLCRNRSCVNPAHLEVVTFQENHRRGVAVITHCRHGHEFTPENTYVRPDRPNNRGCRKCWRRYHPRSTRDRSHGPDGRFIWGPPA